MKTLDEVIKTIENCLNPADKLGNCREECPYIHCCDPMSIPVKKDALHYLKEYRSEKAMWEADRKGYLNWIEQYKEAREKHQQAVIELKKNPALTWDELKAMEGKPVWVEDGLENGEWYIIECFTGSGRFIAHDRYADDTVFKAVDMGNVWQAYRKERE